MMDRGWKPNVEISPTCPRCGSSNTKFCYYNNYSLTQPRYFCKGCRRYWTKGGSLRNVPIGGGCRKSRRGKSIRMPTDGVHSRHLGHHNGTMLESTTSGPNNVSSIDLAAVYANFVSQKPQSETQTRSDIPELASIGIPSIEYLAANLNQDSGFVECGRSSEAQLGGANAIYFTGLDSIQNHQFTSMNAQNDFPMLPPLPGEDIPASEGIVWPTSDTMLSNHNFHADQTPANIGAERQDLETSNGNGSPYSMLNLEAIFRP